jgi:hypothetical protein
MTLDVGEALAKQVQVPAEGRALHLGFAEQNTGVCA